ncbi:DNA-directed RNA polymerase subunit beta' [Patescibacteria group bacterium]|nr:DNA-directed RNA polymerase subunit beta' [Patescibacteria group bacterium]
MMKDRSYKDEFEALKISLASPEVILNWSYGEVTKAETINYRTFKPEKNGLFCEKIFGPVRDYECYCGKYKGVRYKGVICDKCGVEVTRSLVRRERLGHISLASPVVHTWFIRRTPYKIPLILGVRPSDLEAVVYFAMYIVLSVDEDKREGALSRLEEASVARKKKLEDRFNQELQVLAETLDAKKKDVEKILGKARKRGEDKEGLEIRIEALQRKYHRREVFLRGKLAEYGQRLDEKKKELKKRIEKLSKKDMLSEDEFEEMCLWKVDDFFAVGMGAEAIALLLKEVDLDYEIAALDKKLAVGKKTDYQKLVKKMRLLKGLKKSRVDPAWMVLTVLPVIPPELRPMVQLPGGRFATSDLNDLYRRVINRNNRLKDLVQLGAPQVILQNEKRMLQEAIDALIEGPRRQPRRARVLKSLSEVLKGKQGRFRRNLLGKRVDYSGRSVIIVGPDLKVDQVGIPREIALELFRPFVLREIIMRDLAPNLKTAKEVLDAKSGEVWDLLEEIVRDHPVLLNRAPTLHRQNIQAFYPILVDGAAIQFHPVICPGFNADFDGDQMAIHVPLSAESIREAKEKILAPRNLLKLSDGKPIADMKNELSLGIYYLTTEHPGMLGTGSQFFDLEDVVSAYQKDQLHIQAPIRVYWEGEMIETTVGRVVLNLRLPNKLRFYNDAITRGGMKQLLTNCYAIYGEAETVTLIDDLKNLGRIYATLPGVSFSVLDFSVPEGRAELLEGTEKNIEVIEANYRRGLITPQERHVQIVDLWQKTTEEVAELALQKLDDLSMMGMVIKSRSSKVNRDTLRQLGAMRGPMVDSRGEIKETPIRSSTVEGATSFEGFLSAVGGRKGLIDTALLTADAGYLTRRLVDVCQDLLVRGHDCGTEEGLEISYQVEGEADYYKEKLWGRAALVPVINPKTKKVIVGAGELIDSEKVAMIESAGIDKVQVRSPLLCKVPGGVCQLCYGQGMDTGKLVKEGEAVGVIAAQSIGEPGTQLTLRTFHAAGIAREEITQGLPRVDELFEARTPKDPGLLADITGKVSIEPLADGGKTAVIISTKEKRTEEFPLKKEDILAVKDKQKIKAGDILFTTVDRGEVVAPVSGKVQVSKRKLSLEFIIVDQKEYLVPETVELRVKDGDLVEAGDILTEGNLSLEDIVNLKGIVVAQQYLLKEIQRVYRSQAVDIHDKHVELIIRKMSEWARIKDAGDSQWVVGDRVIWLELEQMNKELLAGNKKPARGKRFILGVSRCSLFTRSWLSAASFEETTNVLASASVCERPQTDLLTGLKENVIIGRLIPTS